MLNYILKHYHLQAKDWISYSSAPTKIKNHFELAVKFDKPNRKCLSCSGIRFHKHGRTPRPRKVQLTEYMGLKGHKNSTLLKTQIIKKLTGNPLYMTSSLHTCASASTCVPAWHASIR